MVEGQAEGAGALDDPAECHPSMSRWPGWLWAFRRLPCGCFSGGLRLRCRPGSPREAVIGLQGGDQVRPAVREECPASARQTRIGSESRERSAERQGAGT